MRETFGREKKEKLISAVGRRPQGKGRIHRADSLREAQERQAARSAPATPDALAAPRNLQAQQQQHRSAPSTPTSVAKPTAPPPPPPPPPPPSAGGWLRTSTTFPPGLRSLMPLDRLLVYREPDGPEAARTWDTEKRYRVTDLSGQQLYTAVEESSWCGRCCLGHCRGWTFHVLDLQGHEVLRIERRLRSASCCFPCCLQSRTLSQSCRLVPGEIPPSNARTRDDERTESDVFCRRRWRSTRKASCWARRRRTGTHCGLPSPSATCSTSPCSS
ncbi:phospholipid scramblase 2-like isoform X3 [Phymastichus coffea]|uniref:phospholipid scramblase 2-like isoform X3 n=1 Tax=Phymastichus coffea TaxID=108790 RepID=UPI00273B22CD|nr:phospholipid scramblase 2-like isoform X3 [Phymastichus coffea]